MSSRQKKPKICFQQKWSAICRPTSLIAHLAPRADMAVLALELSWQPMGYRIGADHDKKCICARRITGPPALWVSMAFKQSVPSAEIT
jgi:hypothetical protein